MTLNEKNRDQLPECPRCQSRNDVIPTVWGRLTWELSLYTDQGNIELSGCTECYQG